MQFDVEGDSMPNPYEKEVRYALAELAVEQVRLNLDMQACPHEIEAELIPALRLYRGDEVAIEVENKLAIAELASK
jgi:hypothetical protein